MMMMMVMVMMVMVMMMVMTMMMMMMVMMMPVRGHPKSATLQKPQECMSAQGCMPLPSSFCSPLMAADGVSCVCLMISGKESTRVRSI